MRPDPKCNQNIYQQVKNDDCSMSEGTFSLSSPSSLSTGMSSLPSSSTATTRSSDLLSPYSARVSESGSSSDSMEGFVDITNVLNAFGRVMERLAAKDDFSEKDGEEASGDRWEKSFVEVLRHDKDLLARLRARMSD